MKLCDHCGKHADVLDYSLQTRETVLFTYDLCEGCREALDHYLAEASKVWQEADTPPPLPSQNEELRQLCEPHSTKESDEEGTKRRGKAKPRAKAKDEDKKEDKAHGHGPAHPHGHGHGHTTAAEEKKADA